MSAASRAPLRPRTSPLIASWCTYAPRVPRPVWIPSDTSSTTSSNSARSSSANGADASHEGVEVVGLPLLRAGLGDDLLREDVERQARELDRVELAGAHRGEERGALDELVARQREQAPLRRAGAAVVGPADALEERGDAARRADLAHELHRADVDPELERRGGDERAQVAGAQPGLDPVATLLRQAAVVRGDHAVAQALTELVREPFREPAGVHEHERGVVLADEVGDAVDARRPSARPT